MSALSSEQNNLSVYLQTLYHISVVNAGRDIRNILWPDAQKFIKSKTIAKIQGKGITIS